MVLVAGPDGVIDIALPVALPQSASFGRPALAAKAFARAERLRPDDYACSYYLGRNLLAVGKTEQAAAAKETLRRRHADWQVFLADAMV